MVFIANFQEAEVVTEQTPEEAVCEMFRDPKVKIIGAQYGTQLFKKCIEQLPISDPKEWAYVAIRKCGDGHFLRLVSFDELIDWKLSKLGA